MSTRKPKAGIEERHARACPAPAARCNCEPTYRARVWDPEAKAHLRYKSKNRAEVIAWQQEAVVAVRKGLARAPVPETVEEAAEALLAGMRDGTILDRSGNPYKPATVRTYERAIRLAVAPQLGALRLSDLRRKHVQGYVDKLRADGLSASTVHNRLDPVRVLCRRAIREERLAVDPTANLDLPAIRNGRDRIEAPERAGALIAAAPEDQRALWAVLFYAALRRGEVRALRWDDVDFGEGLLHVRRTWDDVEGEVEPKTLAGRRSVPLAGKVRAALAEHKLLTGRGPGDLVFGRDRDLPFIPSTIRSRARKAWAAAGLEPLSPHEARHCAVSYFRACGWDWKEITEAVGHTDIRTTMNIYAKLLPGSHTERAARLDAFLDGEATG